MHVDVDNYEDGLFWLASAPSVAERLDGHTPLGHGETWLASRALFFYFFFFFFFSLTVAALTDIIVVSEVPPRPGQYEDVKYPHYGDLDT